MLVDDDAFLRDMYATKFTEAGDVVDVAHNGPDALANLKDSEYDVVMMDMVMPGMTGLDLIKEIKSSESTKDIDCIVLSNQGEKSDIDAAKTAGALGYIIKAELIPSEVVKKVHEFIKK